jgi:hypothetical protein
MKPIEGRRSDVRYRKTSVNSDPPIGGTPILTRLPADLLAELDAIVKVERRNRGNAVLVLMAEALAIRRILNADKELQASKTEARLRAIRQANRSPA